MLIPVLVLFCGIYLMSIFAGFGLSLTDWSVARSGLSFIGSNNFKTLFAEQYFRLALINVFIYALITTFFTTALGFLLALLLHNSFRSRNFFRSLFFLPCTLSTLVVGYIFTFVYQKDGGLLNAILGKIGLGFLAGDWLVDPGRALYSICGVGIWMVTGFTAVIILAGLQTVPEELLEAAKIDGANKLNTVKNIIIPIIRPSINIAIILNAIGGLKVFEMVVALTNGGPGHATEVINTLMYRNMSYGSLGYASAIGFTQFVIISVLTLPFLAVLTKSEVEM